MVFHVEDPNLQRVFQTLVPVFLISFQMSPAFSLIHPHASTALVLMVFHASDAPLVNPPQKPEKSRLSNFFWSSFIMSWPSLSASSMASLILSASSASPVFPKLRVVSLSNEASPALVDSAMVSMLSAASFASDDASLKTSPNPRKLARVFIAPWIHWMTTLMPLTTGSRTALTTPVM